MHTSNIQYSGWDNNLQISNGSVELVITLDVGPRILSYKTTHGENVLKNYGEQLGKSGEAEWMIRGGHRVWIAPEDVSLTYVPDNSPVEHRIEGNRVHLVNPGVAPWGVKKEMTITLDETGSGVRIQHTLTNEGSKPIEVASWGLSVMAPGGLEIIPLPPLGEHPRDLLPNRLMIAWPYTDFTDSRWQFGGRFITLLQTADGMPTKLGLAHKEKWIGYLLRNALFIKQFAYEEGANYTDMGCNFETFSNSEMLEIESLGPVKNLVPGESTGHFECWNLFDVSKQPESLKETDLFDWVAPMLKSAGL